MKTIREYIDLIESAQTPVAEGKNNIDDKIIHLMTNGIPADEIARKLDIPVEWVHEVAKYNMPDSAIDYNDPRNSTQGRERFGEQSVAEALSKTALLKQVSAELNNPEFRKKPVDPTKSFTKGDHWQGAKPGDYGYTGYQGHGMPTDRAERDRIRADKKKQQDK
jgi:hypothetical protein